MPEMELIGENYSLFTSKMSIRSGLALKERKVFGYMDWLETLWRQCSPEHGQDRRIPEASALYP